VLLPLLFLPQTIEVYVVPKAAALWVLAFGAWAALIAGEAARGTLLLPKAPGLRALAGFCLAATAATTLSSTPAISFLGAFMRREGLLSLLAYAAVYALVVRLALTRQGATRLLQAMILPAVPTGVYAVARGGLNALRTIPEILWALIFVFVVGLGPFPGVLALGVHTAGVLGKLFAEVIEDVDPRPIEALQATGAGRLAIILYGILPQAAPQFLSYALYRWEVNIRAAAVLGFVGAGGLGQRIHVAISLFHEHQLLTLILAIYVIVTVVDALSAYLRARLL